MIFIWTSQAAKCERAKALIHLIRAKKQYLKVESAAAALKVKFYFWNVGLLVDVTQSKLTSLKISSLPFQTSFMTLKFELLRNWQEKALISLKKKALKNQGGVESLAKLGLR